REVGLGGDRGLQAGGVRFPSAGVDDREAPPVPQRVVGDAVAGDAGDVLHDRLAPAEEPVDERRLADVRPPHDGEHRGGWRRRAVLGVRGAGAVGGPEVVGVEPQRRHRGAVVGCVHALLRISSSSRTMPASSARRVSVAAARALRPPPEGTVSGSPTTTSTRGRQRLRAPSGRRVPREATGRTAAPLVRASHAAPCWAAATSPLPRVPSGNTPTRPPPRNTSSAAVRGRRSASPRRTGSCPIRSKPRPTTPLNISCFTQNTARRPSSPKSSGPSTKALWLATTTTGPLRGIRPRWWTRRRKNG